jgi:hypothetical protein
MKLITVPQLDLLLKPRYIICGAKGPLYIICGHY